MLHFPGWVMSNFIEIVITWLEKGPGEVVQKERGVLLFHHGDLHRHDARAPTQAHKE